MTLSSRLRRNWALFNVNYVLSKSMSDDDNERDSGGVLFENTFNLDSEWGPARLDRRHQFNGYAVFFLPVRRRPVDRLPLPVRAADRRSDRSRHQQQPRRLRSSLQRSRRAVPAQRLPRRAVQGSQLPRAVGTALRRRTTACSSPFDVFNVFDADNIRLSGDHGHQLLRRHRAGRLRLRPADEPELPAGEGRQRELHHDEHPWCAAAGAARSAVRVLRSGLKARGSGLRASSCRCEQSSRSCVHVDAGAICGRGGEELLPAPRWPTAPRASRAMRDGWAGVSRPAATSCRRLTRIIDAERQWLRLPALRADRRAGTWTCAAVVTGTSRERGSSWTDSSRPSGLGPPGPRAVSGIRDRA